MNEQLTCLVNIANTCPCKKTDAYLYTRSRSYEEDVFGNSEIYSTCWKHWGYIYIPKANLALKVTPYKFDDDDNIKKWKGSVIDSHKLFNLFIKIGLDLSQKTHTLVSENFAEKIAAFKNTQCEECSNDKKAEYDAFIQETAKMFFKLHGDQDE